MEPEKKQLINLIFPAGYPKDWDYNSQFEDYILKLGTYTSDDLCKEVVRLTEDKSIVSEQTQELAISNYKTFIETADCSRKSFEQFNGVEKKLDNLLQNIPMFEENCRSFADKSNGINTLRKLNSLTLVKNVQLLEILELPQLMESFIKDNLYEDALELATYVQRLHTKHPDISIFKDILIEVEKLWMVMLHQLLLQLRSDIQLPKCLQIVGHLRRMGVFNESELRIKFLQARNYWLTNSLSSISTTDANYHLSKTIEITRVNLFNIITQYRAIFNDDEHAPLISARNQNVNQNCIFFCWIKQKISEFLIALESDLQGGVTTVDTFLGQCMYFGLSFSKVGCDFRLKLVPIFLKHILSNFQNTIDAATSEFQINMDRFTLINRNHSKPAWKSKSNDNFSPPDGLLEFYPLAEFTNKLLICFNSLRLCAPVAIIGQIIVSLEKSFCMVSDSIYTLYLQEHQAFTPNAKDAFTRLCMCFADDLIPYIQKALHIIYPPSHLAQHLGLNVQMIQENQIAFLNREKMIDKISNLLPTKINPLQMHNEDITITN